MSDLITTGIGPLDMFLGGGLPSGFTVLLLAPTGSGSEIFAKQFAADHPDEDVVFVTTDETADEVQDAAREAGWDMSGVEIMDLQASFAEEVLGDSRSRPERDDARGGFSARDLVETTDSADLLRGASKKRQARQDAVRRTARRVDYLQRLLQPFTRLETPDRLVIHSLDFFFNLYPSDDALNALHALDAANARQGSLMLWVLAKGTRDPATERRLELMADCLIELEVERKGTTFERFLLVKKVKNRPTAVGVSTYQLTERGFNLETLERIV